MPTILTAENLIIARIRALLGAKVRAVDSLPGDWDDDTLKRLLRLLPGVFVAWAGGQAQAQGGYSAALAGRWAVYVATGHASGEHARRAGDAQQVGAYELIEVLLPGLHGYDVGEVGTLTLIGVENLYTGTIDRQGIAVYALTFALGMNFDAEPDPALLAPFQTFAAQYDVAPHDPWGEHRKWLAGDHTTSTPDAADTVALPQP